MYDRLHNRVVFQVADLNESMRLLTMLKADLDMNEDSDGGAYVLKGAFKYLKIQRDILKTVLYE